jgi:hypothetical protein
LSTEPEQHPAGASPGGYEKTDANPASLVHFAVGLALLLVVVWWGMFRVFEFFKKVQEKDLGAAVTPYEQERPLPPLPRLQVEPVEDLALVRARQSAALDGYGWVDRGNGIVHLPISRAMDLLLERGALPVRPNAPAAPDRGTATSAEPHPAAAARATSGGESK